jgi:apolipoprotein D and lipocalin family protein
MKAIILAVLLIVACHAESSLRKDLPPLKTASWIDLTKYQGLWYEIAVIPYIFEKGCINTRATYTAVSDYVQVENQCTRNGVDEDILGKAYPDPSDNAKLKVYFSQVQPFPGNYWVIELDPDYQWAIVGAPSRRFGWILARTPSISEELLDELFGLLIEQYYDISKFVLTTQQY